MRHAVLMLILGLGLSRPSSGFFRDEPVARSPGKREETAEVDCGARHVARSLRQRPDDVLAPLAPCDAECQGSEREALLLVQSALGGTNLAGWGGPGHHCTWSGVICCPAGEAGSSPTNGAMASILSPR